MVKIEVAGLVVQIDNKYPYFEKQCVRYYQRCALEGAFEELQSKPADIYIVTTTGEIEEEHRIAPKFSFDVCESTRIHRKLSTELAAYDAFVMHGVAIAYDGKAIVFAAKSGTGKTTHARMWSKVYGNKTQVIDGDKPTMRFIGNTLYACGGPWCGKERIGEPIMAPVSSICFIEQAPKNHIRSLSAREALPRLMTQIAIPSEQEDACKTYDLIDRVLRQIPFYFLGCTPTEEAAALAHDVLVGE